MGESAVPEQVMVSEQSFQLPLVSNIESPGLAFEIAALSSLLVWTMIFSAKLFDRRPMLARK